MALAFTADQDQFRDSIQRFMTDKMPTTEIRRLMATTRGFDDETWRQVSDQLALPGIHIPEDFGGAGFGAVELSIACEEMGRSLFCGPFFSSAVLSAYALMLTGDEDQLDPWLADIASGTRRGCLAITEHSTLWHDADINTLAKTDSDGQIRLHGDKRFVIDGQTADLFIVAARSESGIGLYLVPDHDPQLGITPLDTMDPTRKMADLHLDGVPAIQLTHQPEQLLQTLLNVACVCLANEMVGGAQQLLQSALDYTQLRFQFGRSIASFQAIKHRLADLLLEVELARSAAYQAAQTLAACKNLRSLSPSQANKLTEHASLAKAAASETYLQAGLETIQLHGGIGFTWENDTHLWFKRAKSSEVLFGTPAEHRERMLTAIEDAATTTEDAA
jgi:alkylation response protein AidB-like acyl-CoA dehydrogenase